MNRDKKIKFIKTATAIAHQLSLVRFSPVMEKNNSRLIIMPRIKGIMANPVSVARQIFQEKAGIPEPTLRKICALCDCNWFEQEEKWLRL